MSSFNFTNVDINSGRKQIIDIFNDKKVIDDRIERTRIVMKKTPIVARSDFFHVEIKWTHEFWQKIDFINQRWFYWLDNRVSRESLK